MKRQPRYLEVVSIGAGLCLAQACNAVAQTYEATDHAYRVVTIADGLEHPWGLAFLPGGDLLVTERPGRLRVIRDGTLVRRPIGGTPEVWAQGQGGLLDVALHPDFESNQWVYLSYSKPLSGDRATTAVLRGRFDGRDLLDVEEIIEARTHSTRGVHFGSRIVFDGNGYMFVSVGERGMMEEAQDRSNHHGTILRLHDDGRVPDDNPFVGVPGVLPEIYAYGVRNPQGLTLHPETGALWDTEHGARGGDEINLIEPGRNYGWPRITWGINYDGQPINGGLREQEAMEQPLHYWVPSIATSGLAIYAGDAFPAWKGSAFVGGLAGAQLARVMFDGTTATSEETLLARYGRRIRDVRDGPDGFIYLLIDEANAPVLRLEPADTN